MDSARESAYQQEILRLQKVYKEKIRIFLGIEQDYYSAPADPAYEYRIGSVHYVCKDGHYLSIDDTPEILRDGVETLYGGDWYSLCEDYYRLAADVISRTGCQIVGHFDLITKFNEKYSFFQQSHPRYREAALGALNQLLERKAVLEINTGAISRGWCRDPYPAPFLLEEMGRQGASVILSSDAHRREDLLFGLTEARTLAEKYHLKMIENPLSR